MPYTLAWHIQDRVVLSQVTGEFTVEDITTFNDALNAFTAQSSEAIVHVVVDTTGLDRFPTTVSALRQALTGQTVTYYGYSIIVTENPLVRFLVAVGMKLTNGRFRTVPTLDAAWAFLKTDETLDFNQAAIPEA